MFLLFQLSWLQQSHGKDFNSVHVGALWSAVKRLAGGKERRQLTGAAGSVQLLGACALTVELLPSLEPRATSIVAHALAKASLHRGPPWNSVWQQLPDAAADKVF